MDPTDLLLRIGNFLLTLLPYLLWCAFWLWAVNWKKAWPILAEGGWAPVVLLMAIVVFVWSHIAPGPCDCLRVVTIPNFWWQLGEVIFLVCIALFCGWLQGLGRMTPIEIEVEPPPVAHGHGHGHH
jgi:hypothetical protein